MRAFVRAPCAMRVLDAKQSIKQPINRFRPPDQARRGAATHANTRRARAARPAARKSDHPFLHPPARAQPRFVRFTTAHSLHLHTARFATKMADEDDLYDDLYDTAVQDGADAAAHDDTAAHDSANPTSSTAHDEFGLDGGDNEGARTEQQQQQQQQNASTSSSAAAASDMPSKTASNDKSQGAGGGSSFIPGGGSSSNAGSSFIPSASAPSSSFIPSSSNNNQNVASSYQQPQQQQNAGMPQYQQQQATGQQQAPAPIPTVSSSHSVYSEDG